MITTLDLRGLRGWQEKAGPNPVSAPAEMWITNDIADFADLWPRSNRLGKAVCYAFQCADILELHCETFVPALNAVPWFVAIANKNGDPLALFPFMIDDTRRIRSLRFIDGALSDYNAPVLFPPALEWNVEDFRLIWRGLKKGLPFDIAVWDKVPERVGEMDNPMTLLTLSPQGQSCHFFRLSGTWKEISTRFPRRKELERKSRRLSQRGPITLEIAETPERYDVLIAALMRQKTQRDLDAPGIRFARSPRLSSLSEGSETIGLSIWSCRPFCTQGQQRYYRRPLGLRSGPSVFFADPKFRRGRVVWLLAGFSPRRHDVSMVPR